MENQLFNLKFASKTLVRQSKKCEKDEKAEKKKLKQVCNWIVQLYWLLISFGRIWLTPLLAHLQAIEKQNVEGAKIYAQNAIRKKNEGMNYLRLSSRIDAVASRLDTAMKMRMVTGSMMNITKTLEMSLNSMNLEQISMTMDKFETQFENLDIASEYVEQTMSQSTSLTTPDDEVNTLMMKVADEHGLELSDAFASNVVPTTTQQHSSLKEEENREAMDLEARLARLKD